MFTKAVIYTTNVCPYCVKAKQALTEAGIPYVEHQKGSPEFRDRDHLQEIVGLQVTTVPQIFLETEGQLRHIGGSDRLIAILQENQ